MSATIKLIYIGRRILQNGKVAHGFQRGEKEQFFMSTTGVIIGHIYPGEIVDKILQLARRPTSLGDSDASQDQRTQWRVLDGIAEQHQRETRLAAKLRSNKLLIADLNALRRLCIGLTWSEKRVLLEFLMDQIERPLKKKGKR